MTTIHDLVAEYELITQDKRTNGLPLERLTRTFLTTDPKWTARFDEVWLWQDWPGRDGNGERTAFARNKGSSTAASQKADR